MRNVLMMSFVLPVMLLSSYAAYSATPVDLSKQPVSTLKPLLPVTSAAASVTGNSPADQIKEINQSVDFNQTTHIRIQQMHAGYMVWGADAVVHIPQSGQGKQGIKSLATLTDANHTTMNGVVYQGLDKELVGISKNLDAKLRKQQAIDQANTLSRQQYATHTKLASAESELMVYIDQQNKAHWAYFVSLYFPASAASLPSEPIYILDATSFQVYETWNDVKSLTEVKGGGLGGNQRHDYVFDGLPGHLAELTLMRDDKYHICYLQNHEAVIRDGRDQKTIMSFPCAAVDAAHNHLYWNGDFDHANGGFSPSNDALYAGSMVKAMYKDWYGLPMLTKENGKPMVLEMVAHSPDIENPGTTAWENAVWESKEQVIYLGDGADDMYPLTSLGVIAHEVSHGFTQQHSNLAYTHQSGGINESFSDMAAQAAEFRSVGKSSWQIGEEIMKHQGEVIRYMDHPAKDCRAKAVSGEDCSIENTVNYHSSTDVHFSSGVFNRAFYLMSTAPDWDVKKAFGVMIQANSHYWTKNATFQQAACGAISAAQDFKYDTEALRSAFKEVGIDTKDCR